MLIEDKIDYKPTPCDIIGDIIEKYWNENCCEDLLIWIKQSYGKEHSCEHIYPVLVSSYDGIVEFQDDWWEGQDNVELVGLIPISEIRVEPNIKYNQIICESL